MEDFKEDERMTFFVRVAPDESEGPVELPLEPNDTLLMSTVRNLFPTACGLKYRSPESDAYRGLRLSEDRLYPPPDSNWSDYIFYCAYPKDNKRKVEEELEMSSSKNKKLDRKRCTDMIVLGMAWKTTEERMREYFSKYGELAIVQLKRDANTQQSKGYGFIRFVDYGAQVTCLSEKHMIDGRFCEVKIPNSKLEGDKQDVERKIYVGNLPDGTTNEMIRDEFSKYGSVQDVFIPKPFRNFAFVSFFDVDVAQELLLKQQITYNDCQLNIGSAAPKLPSHRYNNNSNNSGAGGNTISVNHNSNYTGGGQQPNNSRAGGNNMYNHNKAGRYQYNNNSMGHPNSGPSLMNNNGAPFMSNQNPNWNNNQGMMGGYGVQNQPNVDPTQATALAMNLLQNPNVFNSLCNLIGGMNNGGNRPVGPQGNGPAPGVLPPLDNGNMPANNWSGGPQPGGFMPSGPGGSGGETGGNHHYGGSNNNTNQNRYSRYNKYN